MSNELARDTVGLAFFGQGDIADIGARAKREAGGGTSRGPAPERIATRPASGTILGSNASAQRRAAGAYDDAVPTMQKTLLGQ